MLRSHKYQEPPKKVQAPGFCAPCVKQYRKSEISCGVDNTSHFKRKMLKKDYKLYIALQFK